MAAKREQSLWKGVWPIAERLEQAFSLKAVLSAGVLLFDELSGDEQKKIISQAKKMGITGARDTSLRSALKIITEAAQTQPGIIVEILTEKKAAELSELLKVLSPSNAKKKSAKEG